LALASRLVFVASLTLVALLAPAGAVPSPTFLLQWGSLGSAPGQFNFAHHHAVTTDGKVYVGDLLNHRVQEFGPDGTFQRQWSMPSADGIAVAPDGSVYVAGNNVVVRFTALGAILGSWGGTGSDQGQFRDIFDLAVDAQGFVYVCEFSNHRVQKFTPTGTYVTHWGTEGAGDSQFMVPNGIAVEPGGTVLVADGGTHRIQRFTADGSFVNAWGTYGTGPGQFDFPTRPCVDPNGYILVPEAGNNRVQAFRPDGSFLTMWGSIGSGPGQFYRPTCIATDGTGAIYVLDKDNHRIQKFADVTTRAPSPSWGGLKSRYR
jgi:DNA-binding beta-propeller fold protein YncE